MKKVFGIVLAVLFMVGVAMPVFAAKAEGKKGAEQKFERIVAQVVSLDVAAKTMVVKREENGESRTIKISEKAASKVQVGDRVRIKLKAGTDESAGVRVLGAKPVAEEPTMAPDEKVVTK
jgi:ribosomal protein S17